MIKIESRETWIGNLNLGNLFAKLCISLNVVATKLLLSFSDNLKQLENVNRRLDMQILGYIFLFRWI